MPESSYPFPMYSGLLEPEHYQRIGPAIWLFLWCVSSTTAEKEIDGTVWGIVLGNKPMKLPEISQKFGVNVKTVSRWLDTLEENHYIKVTRAPRGLILSVKNSKKWTDKNVRSEHSEPTNLSDHSNVDQTDKSDQQDKNVQSNKDITEINNAATAITDPDTILKLAHEVEKHFCMRRGQGFNVTSTDFDEIKQLVATGIPIEIVKQSIDKSFAEYKPKHRWDKIRNMAYCIPRCLDEWIKSKVDDSITGAVPPVTVALGSPQQNGAYRSTRKQAQKSNLQRIAEEEEAKHAQG